jgi:hypothetical protein
MVNVLLVGEVNRLNAMGEAAASGDYIPIVDVSATELKKVTKDNLVDGASVASFTATAATIGTLTSTTANVTTLGGSAVRAPASLTGTASLTQAANANRVNIITGTDAAAYALPEATGTGDTYTFVFGEVNTNGTTIVAADTSNTSIGGSINILDADSNAQTAYFGTSGDDTITINGTTTGGLIGDTITLIDIATDQWAVYGQLVCPAGSNVADMFSSAA